MITGVASCEVLSAVGQRSVREPIAKEGAAWKCQAGTRQREKVSAAFSCSAHQRGRACSRALLSRRFGNLFQRLSCTLFVSSSSEIPKGDDAYQKFVPI
jgi:hypothetical protein